MDAPEEIEKNNGHETSSFFSSIFLFVLIFSLMSLLSACTHCMDETKCGSTYATVKDFSGLDGCGWVLVKDNGEKLEPYFPGNPGNESLNTDSFSPSFSLRDGQRVRIGYEVLEDMASICMIGKTVKIICIEEVPSGTD
jgi:hypothetical protein